MQSKATTVEQYVAELPPERRAAIEAVRGVVLRNLGKGYEEVMNYGMIGYVVPHRVFPDGYHCDPRQPVPFAGLASQKQYMSLYLMTVYIDGVEERWLREAFAKAGKKLDMGKGCVRFKRLEDLPLEVVGEAIRRMPVDAYLKQYVQKIPAAAAKRSAARTQSSGDAAAKKTPKGRTSTSDSSSSKTTAAGATARKAKSAKSTRAASARGK